MAELHAVSVPPAARADPALRWYRAGPLRAIDADIHQYLADCRAIPDLPLDLDACDRFWDTAMNLPDPPSDSRPRWIHTDLLAENVLVRNGRLAPVLDFGALALGHPSVDLIAAWELLGANDRDVFRSTLGVDAAGSGSGSGPRLGLRDRCHDVSVLLEHDARTLRTSPRHGPRRARRPRRKPLTYERHGRVTDRRSRVTRRLVVPPRSVFRHDNDQESC
ncbi:MAG: phosphotransferase [Actinomycetota bacterium]|nr:phosphotransferase [Actinomycetota bacterium]